MTTALMLFIAILLTLLLVAIWRDEKKFAAEINKGLFPEPPPPPPTVKPMIFKGQVVGHYESNIPK